MIVTTSGVAAMTLSRMRRRRGGIDPGSSINVATATIQMQKAVFGAVRCGSLLGGSQAGSQAELALSVVRYRNVTAPLTSATSAASSRRAVFLPLSLVGSSVATLNNPIMVAVSGTIDRKPS